MKKFGKLWLLPLCLIAVLFTSCSDDKTSLGGGSYTAGDNSMVFTLSKSGVSFTMMKVAAGSFDMGATSEQTGARTNESPVHNVKFTRDYYMGQTEVTQELWQAVMGYNPSTNKNPKAPVTNVSWNESQIFINRLNSMISVPGERFSLPSEAEWEYAARGGQSTNTNAYSGFNVLDSIGWYNGNSNGMAHPVGALKANELGIFDMSGNVSEWCQDMYVAYAQDSLTDPAANVEGSAPVLRGGSWASTTTDECRTAYRSTARADFKDYSTGLRICLHYYAKTQPVVPPVDTTAVDTTKVDTTKVDTTALPTPAAVRFRR